MNDSPQTTRTIKFAFIFFGSIGTILLIRWVVTPMLPRSATPMPLSLQQPISFVILGVGLFGFAMLVAAAVSGVLLVVSLFQTFRNRGRAS
jgi:hypothetical protein